MPKGRRPIMQIKTKDGKVIKCALRNCNDKLWMDERGRIKSR